MTATQQLQAATSGQTLIDTRNRTMTLAAYASPALTSTASSLHTAIKGNSAYRADMNLLYGTTYNSNGSTSSFDNTTLNTIVVQNGYSQSSYLSRMQKAASLYRALQANTTRRTTFNSRYAVSLPATGTPPQTGRWKLFETINKPGYVQSTFLASLCTSGCTSTTTTTTTALSSSATNLVNAIRANTSYRSNLNLLYGTTLASTGAISNNDRAVLNSIASASGYSQSDYIGDLSRAAGLYRALQANTAIRTSFNSRYGATLAATGKPSSTNRTKLFAQVNKSGYNQSSFLSSLLGSIIKPVTNTIGRLFGSTSFWNKKVSSVGVRSNSSTMVQELIRNTKLASPWINSSSYSTPYYVVNSSTPKVPLYIVKNGSPLTFTNLYKEAIKGVPLPTNVKAAGGTDGHVTIYDSSTDTLYEFWQFKYKNGRWEAAWGGILKNASTSNGTMPVVTNSAGGPEFWGATATGLPAIAGTILLKELQAGVIPHALAFAIPQPKSGTFISPATRTDGWINSPNAIPEGMRFRFPSNVYINPNWSPIMKMMVTAIRDYGMVLRDVAGAVTFYAEDRTPYGSTNPYTQYYGGKQLWDVMKEIPWNQLQAIH